MITVSTITTTSIAGTTITTAIPMLMKTNKPPHKRRAVASDAAGPSAPAASQSAGMTESEAAALYRLMTWLSPSFPVGAFSYFQRPSSGAVEAGDVTNAASLREWLVAMLKDGAGNLRLAFFLAQNAPGRVYPAMMRGLQKLPSSPTVFMPSRERHLENHGAGPGIHRKSRAPRRGTTAQLDRLVDVCRKRDRLFRSRSVSSAQPHAIFRSHPQFHGFLHALTSNWISAGARLIPLGADRQASVCWRSLKPSWRIPQKTRARRFARRPR